MKGHLLSIVLFILGVVAFVVAWLAGVQVLGAAALGLAIELLGLILYRRGR
jgi:cytochrome c oxidase assembly factor CtaG